jgi:hypothetical protein
MAGLLQGSARCGAGSISSLTRHRATPWPRHPSGPGRAIATLIMSGSLTAPCRAREEQHAPYSSRSDRRGAGNNCLRR